MLSFIPSYMKLWSQDSNATSSYKVLTISSESNNPSSISLYLMKVLLNCLKLKWFECKLWMSMNPYITWNYYFSKSLHIVWSQICGYVFIIFNLSYIFILKLFLKVLYSLLILQRFTFKTANMNAGIHRGISSEAQETN